MEVKIISTELIKPASPTPPHSRFINLSLIDQLSPRVFIPLIFYYPRHQMGAAATSADICGRLKNSLSQSLVGFYSLAGKFVFQENYIDCNDQGVEFYETRVLNCQLEELLKDKPEESLTALIASGLTRTKYSGKEDVPMVVQANFFDCGGLALAVSLHHLIGDMAAFVNFLNSWASTAGEVGSPDKKSLLAHRHLFPSAPGVTRQQQPIDLNTKCRRFVIDQGKLASLRRKRKNGGVIPTRVEAITALICRCMARASRKKFDRVDARGFIVFHPVNLRRKLEPPLPDDTFGNFWFLSVTSPEGSPVDDEVGNLEKQLRHVFSSINGELGRDLEGPQRYEKAMKAMTEAMQKNEGKEVEIYLFSSWSKFQYYEVDFGWGKPEWVSHAPTPVKNYCLFIDQKEGDGVEVWVNMEPNQLIKFEKDKELISYIC